MIAFGFLCAALVGLSLGLLGGGGSILTVPIFVYVLGYAAKPAIAMTLPVVGTASLVGAVGHWRDGNVELRTALLFGAVAMTGAFAGARASELVSGTVQLATLGVVMLVAAVAMLRGRRERAPTTARAGSLPVLLGAAVAVGLLTGFVGIGGGFLVVPALVLLAGTTMKQAVGTSLVVIAMNSAAGFAGYLGRVDVPWGFLAAFTLVAVGGILAGTRLVRHVPQHQLRRAFAIFLVLMAALVLHQNRSVLTSSRASPASPAVTR
ncbi:MAG TPA: sulfite exporter TauE/SafE family protein [Gemmatimonadaceae bacterium]|nr:sulfite exporter TauE/SafE family protein [Gemmatimonadaceae bacterium]